PSTDPVVHVRWNRTQDTQSDVWESTYQEWLFGDTMKLVITYDNGSSIQNNDFQVNWGDALKFTLVIPKRFFEGTTQLKEASVGANMGNGSTWSDFYLTYWIPESGPAEWHVWSSVYNQMANGTKDPKAFFELHRWACGTFEDTDVFNVTFVGSFNTTAPVGVYHTNAHCMDTAGNYLNPSYYSYGFSGEVPLPPIALECTLEDEWWIYEPDTWPEYTMGVYDEAHTPIRYADAFEQVLFEMNLTEPIGFASFSLTDITWNSNYTMVINRTQPVYWGDPYTPWDTWESWESPRLGFTYNATTGLTEVFCYYENSTWTWETWEQGGGNWRYEPGFIINNSILNDFYIFNTSESGPIGETTVRWQGYFTDQICYDPWEDDYGVTFRVWAWNPQEMGTCDIEGVPASPTHEFQMADGLILALHDFIVDGFIRDPTTGDVLQDVDRNQQFNVSLDVYAPAEVINSTSDPVEWIDYDDFNTSIWWRERTELEIVVYDLYGYYWKGNETHSTNLNIQIQIAINITTLTVQEQFTSICKEVWENYNWTLVERTEQNSSSPIPLPAMMEITNIAFEVGAAFSQLTFQAKFLDETPDASFSPWLYAYRNRWIQNNETGTWENRWERGWDYFNIGHACLWHPSQLILGEVWMGWVPEIWTVTDEGALDLDGDPDTITDQYYVKQLYNWHDEREWSYDYLAVTLVFDPSPQLGNESEVFWSWNWMGLHTETCTYTWNETFYWYHADDMSPVNSTEMAEIKDLLWTNETEMIPAPGYDWIAWMSSNRSWDQLQNDYWWLDDNTWTWSWFGFGTGQEFYLATDSNSTTWASFRSEFAGLMLFTDNTTLGGNCVPDFTVRDGFVDSDEVTHFFLIDNVGSIDFTLPFDSTSYTGSVTVPANTSVNYGVRIYDVNGTLYPVQSQYGRGVKGCWDYYGSADGLIGLNATMFDYTLSTATIDEMAFDVHYDMLLANTTENPDPNNNLVQIKVDQYIGDWTLHHFDNKVLQGRSLAISYFGDLSTYTFTEFSIDDTPVSNSNGDTAIGDIYAFGADGRTFAEIAMGGQEYVWGYDGGTYNSTAASVPLGAFGAMYQSESGSSVAQWEIESTYYFMLSAFPNWDGYSIDNDPSFGIYTTALDMVITSGGDGGDGNGGGGLPEVLGPALIIVLVAVIVVIVVAVAVMNIRNRESDYGKTTTEPVSDYWLDSK
ncbi:MAG: hypothetical protein ACFFCO_06010, partial [Promethearchaeota archaeon]